MNCKKGNSDSLCEGSIKMVTNILRLSSLSIASMSLGAAGRPVSARSRSSVKDFSMTTEEAVVPQLPGSHQSQVPQSRLKPVTYLEELKDGFVLHDDKNVDGMASKYIEWFHKKNRHDSREALENPPIILPPPPYVQKYK